MSERELERAALDAAETGGRIGQRAVLALTTRCRPSLDRHGRATEELARHLLAVERTLGPRMTPRAAASFQTFVAEVGARLAGSIDMPENDVPSWLDQPRPLDGFRSSERLPERADVVVIGAGLTGASAAYHLLPHVRRGLRVVVLESFGPASQASGRNGGNFELMPENFLGSYEGLPREREKWLARTRRSLRGEALIREGARQARVILEFCRRNTERLLAIASRERIACDLSPSGWLRIADTRDEERALALEVALAAELGIQLDLWSPGDIRKHTKVPARFAGRFAKRSGNYHPWKLVTALLERATRRGILLHTGTQVERLSRARDGGPVVETARGRIMARSVVVATNAFTSTLLPELEWIRYYQSQILTLEHVEDTMRGMTVTEKKGDLYYNFPGARRYTDASKTRRGMLLVGGGLDRPGKDPRKLTRSRAVLDLVLEQTDERFPLTRKQPPSRLWTGPMAFTPDRLPALGVLRAEGRPEGLVVAAGFNGYGGSYCLEAGHVAANLATGGRPPKHAPEDVFSPNRFG